MPEGTVKFFNESKGYGFIKPDRDMSGSAPSDVFLHIREIKASGIEKVAEGQRLSYELAPPTNGKGAKALKIKVI